MSDKEKIRVVTSAIYLCCRKFKLGARRHNNIASSRESTTAQMAGINYYEIISFQLAGSLQRP